MLFNHGRNPYGLNLGLIFIYKSRSISISKLGYVYSSGRSAFLENNGSIQIIEHAGFIYIPSRLNKFCEGQPLYFNLSKFDFDFHSSFIHRQFCTHPPSHFWSRVCVRLMGFSDLESRGCHLRPQMALFAFSSLPKRHGLETGGVLSLFQKGG